MHIARIIMVVFAMLLASSVSSHANPFIEADPMIQRGAAEQLARQFGGLRGMISSKTVKREPATEIDPVRTQAISRAMTPGDWLRAKREAEDLEEKMRLEAEASQAEAGDIVGEIAAPLSEPAKPRAVPIYQLRRPVRVIYTANAPL